LLTTATSNFNSKRDAAASAFKTLKTAGLRDAALTAACFMTAAEAAADKRDALRGALCAYAAARDEYRTARNELERARAATVADAFCSLPDALEEAEQRTKQLLTPGSKTEQPPRAAAATPVTEPQQQIAAQPAPQPVQQPSSNSFIRNIATALHNPVLQHPDSRVDHVVLLIVAPIRRFEVTEIHDQETIKTRLGGECVRLLNNDEVATYHLGRLKSFSLYFVRPGTPGFENLVSQPVALTVPDMDTHDEESWSEPLPLGNGGVSWTNYCGVKTKMVDTPWVFATQQEYEQYLRLVTECGEAGSVRQYLRQHKQTKAKNDGGNASE
jgi:hypothetical protein